MLTLNNKKMSKSTGNNILPNELFSGNNKLFSKPFDPNIVRFFFLQAHYRSVLDISNTALEASEKGFNRMVDMIDRFNNIKTADTTSSNLIEKLKNWEIKCFNALNDDFNTPILIAEIFNFSEILKLIESNQLELNQKNKSEVIDFFDSILNQILGLNYKKEDPKNDSLLKVLLNIRNDARSNKDFGLSDRIRDELQKIGIKINDKDL